MSDVIWFGIAIFGFFAVIEIVARLVIRQARKPVYRTVFGPSRIRPECNARGCISTPVPQEGPFCESHDWADA